MVRRSQLGTNAREGRTQVLRLKSWQELASAGAEGFARLEVVFIVFLVVDVTSVGPKEEAVPERLGQMHAQAAAGGIGHRIDESVDPRRLGRCHLPVFAPAGIDAVTVV